MRFRSIFANVAMSALAAACMTAQSVQGSDCGYPVLRVVHYQSHGPIYYARPVYYAGPVYYAYPSSRACYARPLYYAPSSSYQRAGAPTYSRPQTPPTQPTTTTTVGMVDNRFSPQTINVQPGTTVRWVNYGQHTHMVTANDDSWDSGDIKPGASYSATFNRAGTFYYYCRHHAQDRMRGVIVVGSAARSENGGGGPSEY